MNSPLDWRALPLAVGVTAAFRSSAIRRLISQSNIQSPVQIFAQVFVVGPAVALSILVTALIARSSGVIGRNQNIYVIAGGLVLAAWFAVSTAIAVAGGFSPAVTATLHWRCLPSPWRFPLPSE